MSGGVIGAIRSPDSLEKRVAAGSVPPPTCIFPVLYRQPVVAHPDPTPSASSSRHPPASPTTPLRLPLRPPGTTRALSRPVPDGGGPLFSEGRSMHAYRTHN